MKDRPILFSAPMVRAILEGRKTQTRRIVNDVEMIGPRGSEDDPASWGYEGRDGRWYVLARGHHGHMVGETRSIACPYGEPGDRLWVRETWGAGTRPCPVHGWRDGIEYRADEAYLGGVDALPLHEARVPDGFDLDSVRSGWRPSIHMPRWASRITLRVTSVRVERLQAITPEGALAEGIGVVSHGGAEDVWLFNAGDTRNPRTAFGYLWDEINGARASWASNPWVWVVGFAREVPT